MILFIIFIIAFLLLLITYVILDYKLLKSLIITTSITILSFVIIFFVDECHQKNLTEQIVINNKAMDRQKNREFKIIQQEAIFSDKTSILLLSKNYNCYRNTLSHERSLTIEEEAAICIDRLYRSTITDKFFWYSYSIVDGKLRGEYIEITTEEQVKKYLIKADNVLYSKLFGEPKPY